MPILQIQALPQKPETDVPRAMERVCAAVAAAANRPLKEVWATWQTVPFDRYVEGNAWVSEQPRSTHPPLVNLIAFESASPEMVEKMLEAAADALAEALQLERGNVFVLHTAARSGRVYIGGGFPRLPSEA